MFTSSIWSLIANLNLTIFLFYSIIIKKFPSASTKPENQSKNSDLFLLDKKLLTWKHLFLLLQTLEYYFLK